MKDKIANITRKLIKGTILGGLLIAGTTILGASCAGCIDDIVGTRGFYNAHEFKYQGKPAVIQGEDRLFFDRYHLILNETDHLYEGEITSDNGEKIKFDTMSYSVE